MVPSCVAEFANKQVQILRPDAPSSARFQNRVLQADLYDFDDAHWIKARGRALACYLIAAKAGGAIRVFADDRQIGRYSTQSLPAQNQPDRLMKHLVLWDGAGDDVSVTDGIRIARCLRPERPVVQNLFSWHALPDEDRRDALIGVLVESQGAPAAVEFGAA